MDKETKRILNKVKDTTIKEELTTLLLNGYEIIGEYKRNSNYIYVAKEGETAIPFCLNDRTFNAEGEMVFNKYNIISKWAFLWLWIFPTYISVDENTIMYFKKVRGKYYILKIKEKEV